MSRPPETPNRPRADFEVVEAEQSGVSTATEHERSELDLDDGDDADPITYQHIRSVLASVSRAGEWLVPDRLRASALLGELTLDFTNADLPSDRLVEVRCMAIGGQVNLIVPRGSEVETDDVQAIAGEIAHKTASKRKRGFVRRVLRGEEREPPSPRGDDEPLLVIVSGHAIAGAIHVVER